MTSKYDRTYSLEITTKNGGWCKLDGLAGYDVERWIDLLSNTRCTWSLTCKVEEDETSVQG